MKTRSSGNRGEAEVAKYLRKQGYVLLASQWRCRFGELDLVAKDKQGTICFVEVKLRRSADFALARENVTLRKQERIRQTALLYLAAHENMTKPARFDVIEIYAPEGAATRKPVLTHLEDAFQ